MEHVVFECLDGKHSLNDIKQQLEQKFPQHTITIREIQSLIGSMNQLGLLATDSTGQTAPLARRHRKVIKQKTLGLLSSVLSLRFPGVDPERFLNWLYPKVRWMFSAPFVWLCIAIGVLAVLLVVTNLGEFYSRLPAFQTFFAAQNIVVMGLILIGIKTIHELGHGLMCKHFGGECHEIGFMLLVLMPAMYCNTSDSWILPNKWHRMAIGAAGIFVEVAFAAFATIVWWYTQPGWIHYLALNVMFICSVSTVLFNGNPLLRYDGYYILSDYLEIPNLTQKSRDALLNKLRTICLGMKPMPSRLLPQRNQLAFAMFSLASVFYRWFILIMILWFLSKVFEPWGLAVLGHMMIAISLIGLVVVPMWKMVRFFSFPGRLREVKRPRLIATSLVVAGVVLSFCLVPFNYHVSTSAIVRPIDASRIYVRTPGVIGEQHVAAGDDVTPDQTLAVLTNPSIRLALEKIDGEISLLNSEIEMLKRLRGRFALAESLIVKKQSELKSAKRQYDRLADRENQLVLKSPVAGTIIPPEFVSSRGDDADELEGWTGTPLDPENKSAFLETDTLFCLVGNAADNRIVLVVDQSHVSLIQPGQSVVVLLDEYPGQRIDGVITEVSRSKMERAPRELARSRGGGLETRPDASGNETAMFTSYEAIVSFEETSLTILPGFRGQAKVNVGSASLGTQLLRYLRTIIRFR